MIYTYLRLYISTDTENSKNHCSYYILKVQHPWSSMHSWVCIMCTKNTKLQKIIFMKEANNEKCNILLYYLNI